MVIAVDFDGTIVVQDGRVYDDLDSPLEFMPGAKEGLAALKAAGHTLLLWSARMNAALLVDPMLDPLVRSGGRRVDLATWEAQRPLQQAKVEQMLAFIERELPGTFDAVDDGRSGKPIVDAFIDDKAVRAGHGPGAASWQRIAWLYGEQRQSTQG